LALTCQPRKPIGQIGFQVVHIFKSDMQAQRKAGFRPVFRRAAAAGLPGEAERFIAALAGPHTEHAQAVQHPRDFGPVIFLQDDAKGT